jgi:hypothetical protein
MVIRRNYFSERRGIFHYVVIVELGVLKRVEREDSRETRLSKRKVTKTSLRQEHSFSIFQHPNPQSLSLDVMVLLLGMTEVSRPVLNERKFLPPPMAMAVGNQENLAVPRKQCSACYPRHYTFRSIKGGYCVEGNSPNMDFVEIFDIYHG